MKVFTSKTQKVGEVGEKIASMFLMKHGFIILESNFSTFFGEVDIIAEKDNIIHFVEVKSIRRNFIEKNRGETVYNPAENLHEKKIKKFLKTAQLYLLEKRIDENKLWQCDLLVVFIDIDKKKGKVEVFESFV